MSTEASSTLQTRVDYVCSMPGVNVDPSAVVRLVNTLMQHGYPRPGVYPTDDGHVLLEWTDGFSLEVQTP